MAIASLMTNLITLQVSIITVKLVNEQCQLNLYENMGSFALSQRKGEEVSTKRPLWPKSYRNLVPSARSFRPVVH